MGAGATTCPFCGGSASLLQEVADVPVPDARLLERFRGQRIVCIHHDCNKAFSIRRGDVKIRRD